jgi:hypothetical protein
MTDSSDDFWKPFGESTWRDLAATAGASELQLKFSVARFNGATAARAAAIAGYSGTRDELRRAGYSAVRSAAVTALLELAETNAPEAAGLTDEEVAAKVAKLVRSPDPQISLKACELHDRRKQRQAELNRDKPDESLAEQLYSIIALVPHEEVGAFLAMSAFESKAGNIVNFRFLRECAPAISKRYAKAWQEWRNKDHRWTKFLDEVASGPLLEGHDLVAAVKGKLPARLTVNPSNAEATDNA